MNNIAKSAGMVTLSALLISNTVLACDHNCGNKARHNAYKPYKAGKNAAYYNELSEFYSMAAAKASAKESSERVNYYYDKASKAQRKQSSPESVSQKNPDYEAVRNARKLLTQNTNTRTKGMYPMDLAAAHFYYDCWASAYKFGAQGTTCTQHCMAGFFKHMNTVMNNEAAYSGDISIDQSKHIERYFTESHKVGTMYFPFDNHTNILNNDKAVIASEAALLASKDYAIVVVGNADRVGTKNYNIDLSVKRAKNVKHWLNGHGISVEGVDVVAFGKSRVSEAYGKVTYDDSANRRVDIYAIKKQHGCGSSVSCH